MKLRESIEVPAFPEQVWAMIADPDTWPGWNPKIQTVRRDRKGLAQVGEQFHANFKMRGRELPSNVEVLQLDPYVHLLLRQSYDYQQRIRSVEVTFDLTAKANGVRLTQTVDLSRTGIWWPLRLLIALIHRFGRPSGKGPLDELQAFFTTLRAGESGSGSRMRG